MTHKAGETRDAATRGVHRKLAREMARREKVNGQLKAAAVLWIATQRDTQEARGQFLQWQSAEAKRHLMRMSTREHAAHWKVLHLMAAQQEIERNIRALSVECGRRGL